jgi:Ca2+-binding EF-hand superfamily protein
MEADSRALFCDLDGDQGLDFEEFYAMLNPAVREGFSRAHIRQWYDDARRSRIAGVGLGADRTGKTVDGKEVDEEQRRMGASEIVILSSSSSAPTPGSTGTSAAAERLSLNEFFLWALVEAGKSFGSYLAPLQYGSNALGRLFERYDANANGVLDADELLQLCEDLGFASSSQKILTSLDPDASGSISYAELVQSLSTQIPADLDVKAFLTALVCSLTADKDLKDAATHVDRRGWRPLRGPTPERLQAELQGLLSENGLFAMDLIGLFQTRKGVLGLNQKTKLDELEFTTNLRKQFFWTGPAQAVSDLFETIDSDNSGLIGFEELFELFTGKRHALDSRQRPAFEMRLKPPAGAPWRRLNDLQWDSDVLRVLVLDMLERQDWPNGQRATPADLLRAWEGRRGLNKREFLLRVERSFFAEPSDIGLWGRDGKRVASEAFGEMMRTVIGENFLQKVGLVHLERWIHGMVPDGHGGCKQAERANAYTVSELPLKSKRQLKNERAKRAAEDAAKKEAAKRADVKVDWKLKARCGIAAAAHSFREREELRMQAHAEWILDRVRPGNDPKGGNRYLPPLERWEVDGRPDLAEEILKSHQRRRSPFSPRLMTPLQRIANPSPRQLVRRQRRAEARHEEELELQAEIAKRKLGITPAPGSFSSKPSPRAQLAPLTREPRRPPGGAKLSEADELHFQLQCLMWMKQRPRDREGGRRAGREEEGGVSEM